MESGRGEVMVTAYNMMIIEAEIEGNEGDTIRATVTCNDITTKQKQQHAVNCPTQHNHCHNIRC